MAMNRHVESTSNWSCENECELSRCTKIIDHMPCDNVQLFDFLSEDQGVSLQPPNVGDNLTLKECSIDLHINSLTECMSAIKSGNSSQSLNLNSTSTKSGHKYIDGLIVLSEARFIEAYSGSTSEYLITAQGELISDCADSKIYKATLKLAKAENDLHLKLKGLYMEESVWVFGIFIKLGEKCDAKLDIFQGMSNSKNVSFAEEMNKFSKLLSIVSLCKSSSSQSAQNKVGIKDATKEIGAINEERKEEFDCSHILNTSNIQSSIELKEDLASDKIINKLLGKHLSSTSCNCNIEEIVNTVVDKRIKKLELELYEKIESKINQTNKLLMEKLDSIERLIKQ